MNSTREFIEQKLIGDELPSLDLALLTHQGRRYALSRLSLVYFRALLRVGVHAAELAFMTREFPLEFTIPLLSMRASFGIASSLWWGPLEAVRRHVLDHMRGGRPDRACKNVEAWSCIALGLGLGVCGVAAWIVTHEPAMTWWFDGLYGSYLLVSALALLVDLWSRTIHAGAFAMGRVYRTRWSMFVPDLLELGLIIGLWRVIGPFALGASMLLTSLFRSALTLHYTRPAYRRHRLPWPRFLRLRSLAVLSFEDLRVAARGLLGSVPNQLDRVLLMALLIAGAQAHDLLPIAAPYYALRPVAGVAQGWARTYYTDLVRADSLAMTLFRARLERLLRSTSLLAGGVAAASLLLGSFALFGPLGIEAAAWLVPLCLLRSHFSLLQMRAIAYARTDALAALSAMLGVAVLCAFVMQSSDRVRIAVVTLVLVGAALGAAYVQRRMKKRVIPSSQKLALGAWLSQLCEDANPVRLHIACVASHLARPASIIHQLHACPSTRRTTRVGSMWILWWEDGRAPLSASQLALALSGTCQQHVHCDASTGLLALEHAARHDMLPHELNEALFEASSTNTARELRERFARELPRGHVIDSEHASPLLAQLPRGELSLIRRALMAETREQKTVPRRAPWQVAVYAPRGEPQLMFVWPAHTENAGPFRRSVVQAGWRESLPIRLSPRAQAKRAAAARE